MTNFHFEVSSQTRVPKELTTDQKQSRVESARELVRLFDEINDPHLIIYIDEKWFYHRHVGTKQTNRTWCRSVADKKPIPRRTQSDAKSHVIMAATFAGDFHFELIPGGRTVNGEFYIEFLKTYAC